VIKRLLLGTAAGALGAAFATGAWPRPSVDTELEQVVVTAQRREQSAQDVGIALSVISGEQLTARGVTNVNQLQYQTPSLEVVPAFGGGQPQFRLRGVGFDDYATNNTPTVGVYVDEVAYPVPAVTQGVLYDIDRVEVLRGPQGTLYGRNTTGGAINFITRRPTDQLSAGITAEYGRFDSVQGRGLRLRPTQRYPEGTPVGGRPSRAAPGRQNRVTGEKLGDADRTSVRGQLDWTPNDKVDVLLNAHYGRDKSDGQGLYLLNRWARPATPADNATGWGGSAAFATLRRRRRRRQTLARQQVGRRSITANIDLGFAKLTSISVLRTAHRRE
jgi:iron complex outermembrane receptor protein